MNEHIENRLIQLRREMLRAEFLARAVLRISGDPEGDREDLQGRLQEIEAISENLVGLIDYVSGEYEPHILRRHAASLEEEANHDDL